MKILLLYLLSFLSILSIGQTKNTSTEVIDYREVDGKIIVTMAVNGVMADFVLDLAGHTAVLPEYVEKFKINPSEPGQLSYDKFQHKVVPVTSVLKIGTLSLGNSIFGNDVPTFVLQDEPYLRKLGVAGVVGSSLFSNVVLTIDSRRKKLTVSVPYRPSYMKLDHRVNMGIISGHGVVVPLNLNGVDFSLLLDTWNDATVVLNEKDFTALQASNGENMPLTVGYGKAENFTNTKMPEARFVKEVLGIVPVLEDKTLPRSILGSGILKRGLLSIDYQHRRVYFQPFDLAPVKDDIEDVPEVTVEDGKLNAITRDYFLKHIFDYRTNKEFIYQGEKPIVIDFWATWCGPCMRLLPEMEKLAAKYKGQVVFLKVNADKEKELCSMFNVMALPTLFFIPVGGKPIIEVGATPQKFIKIIEEQLLKK